MSPKTHETRARHLSTAQLIIENTLAHPEILEVAATRGYGESEMAEGQRLHQAAIEAVDAQAAAAGAARRATERVSATGKQARDAYQGLAQTVRAIFPVNSSQRKALEVAGPMSDDSAKFISAATTLFNNALSITDIGLVLARYGYSIPTLQHERELIATYKQALRAQALAKGAAKRATLTQTKALGALQQWIAQYTKIARVALRKRPELLKALGITSQNGHSAHNDTPETSPQQPASQS
jgi:hypothetical protein